MDKQTIVCDLHLFTKKYNVYLVKENKETFSESLMGVFDFDNIEETLLEICFKTDVHNIHLFGPMDYIEHIAENIIKKNPHNQFDIQVEVN